jgi:hypothetical protein
MNNTMSNEPPWSVEYTGQPAYVVIWKVTDLKVRIMEIRYVGTHENADYRRIS